MPGGVIAPDIDAFWRMVFTETVVNARMATETMGNDQRVFRIFALVVERM